MKKKPIKKIIIKNISRVPSVDKYLKEKQELSISVKKQAATIDALKRQNNELRDRINKDEKSGPKPILWPELEKEVLNAGNKSYYLPRKKKSPPFTINWVMPPALAASGGQADIIRTIAYMESKGYKCRLYFFDYAGVSNLKKTEKIISGYTKIKAKVFYNTKNMKDADIVFATHWTTAYPVLNFKGSAAKYYYIQDFEPYFHPPGTLNFLAESTYKFGFRGLTIGNWLSQKLSKEYSMKCDYFDFAFNPEEYFIAPKSTNRKNIIFYARPRTPRRGFELGILALQKFHEINPDYTIHFIGDDISSYKIQFPYKQHSTLTPKQLNELYNKSAAGLAISFTNISLVPLEMIAAGCIPVVNDGENTRAVPYKDNMVYVQPTPDDLCKGLQKAIQLNDKRYRVKAAEQVKKYNWDNSNKKIEEILVKDFS